MAAAVAANEGGFWCEYRVLRATADRRRHDHYRGGHRPNGGQGLPKSGKKTMGAFALSKRLPVVQPVVSKESIVAVVGFCYSSPGSALVEAFELSVWSTPASRQI